MSPRFGLDLDGLRAGVDAGDVDTVLVVATDIQGRLVGKRMSARYMCDHIFGEGKPGYLEACSYLWAVDVDMNTVDGYRMSSWETGYGDVVLQPDLATLRWVGWHPGSVLVTADARWPDGSLVVASPRQVLRGQLDRLAERGWNAQAGTELEFILFAETYEEAWRSGYRDMRPANLYNVDYSILGTSRVEPLLRRIRNEMDAAGMVVESAKGECNLGQHEIAFRYDEALTTCDSHVLYKTGAKEIAAQDGYAITFMAKYDEREGNSCHIHLSLRDADGRSVFARSSSGHGGSDGGGNGHGAVRTAEFGHFMAGMLATLPEMTLLFAPNVNSYKRFAAGSFAPTAAVWGEDNRTCALRVVGHEPPSVRVENRVPGGDVNPYMAVAAMVAGGLHGIDNELPLPPAYVGNAYAAAAEGKDVETVPHTLRDAAALFETSEVARAAFGDEVVDHYVNAARIELAAFDSAVTDWELRRGFERL